ncbi:MAG TPA: DUF1839 family protein [Solirubrobacterales bacterium]
MPGATSTAFVSLLGLDPTAYETHLLHGADRDYPETNCYTDILVEFVHATGSDPVAMLGCVLPVDFEGDQWTFFKPRPEDVEALYGIDIHEMQPYRPLPDQIAEQIASGRTLVVELDSYHLPDTAATSYRQAHVKSSVIAEAIDPAVELLRYFHGAGYHELRGEDYRGAFRLDPGLSADVLPPYTELLRRDAGPALEGEELRVVTRELLARQIGRRPSDNPFERFGASLAANLPELLAGDVQRFHDYAFATTRMVGSAFEVGATHVVWALGDEAAEAAARMGEIVAGCKALSFKLARRRPFDPTSAVAALAEAWDASFGELEDALR